MTLPQSVAYTRTALKPNRLADSSIWSAIKCLLCLSISDAVDVVAFIYMWFMLIT
uniref:Uncharacterized protein n=1 Tax=Solanum tuberosum TaxID=4113 RepID=M1D532_SOLTU